MIKDCVFAPWLGTMLSIFNVNGKNTCRSVRYLGSFLQTDLLEQRDEARVVVDGVPAVVPV
jgi:hypothetical protein